MARIFLCHASEDKPQVREVYRRLQDIEGFEPWLDEEELLPGQVWAREISLALKASDFILIFLSTTSVSKRGYVRREMRMALDALQEVPDGTIFTIPVRIDDCEVPPEFQPYHYANLFDQRGFERLVRAIQTELAKRQPQQDAPSLLPPTFTNSIGMEFVLLPAGTFLMGSQDTDAEARSNEKPVHPVTISQPFYLAKYPVTQAQWVAVMGTNPSYFRGDLNHPVGKVSWHDVHTFLCTLTEREGGRDYRLPTEAQWEYACRAGSTALYGFGDDVKRLGDYAYYRANSGGAPYPVGEKAPNAWGLYDMHGNINEWVQDWYGPYPPGLVVDFRGPDAGAGRVVRGGSWGDSAQDVRSASRDWFDPGDGLDSLGFRPASSGPTT